MQFRSMKFKVMSLLTLLACTVAPVRAADPAGQDSLNRVVMGLGSADEVLASLEYVVVKLAGKKASYEDNIKPNLEIFLYGVSTDQPIRFDLTFDETEGSLIQSIIPISNLKEFLLDNLDPIGIESKADRSDKELYTLSGSVYEGWLRYLPKPTPYAVIYSKKDALAKGMPHPALLHSEQAENSQMVFLSLDNTAARQASRQKAFDKYIENQLKDFQKLTTETKEQHELRKQLRLQTLSVLKQWVVEAAKIRLGMKVDQQKSDAPSTLSFSALPETDLAKDLSRVRKEVSPFAGISPPVRSVLTGRLHLPVDEKRKEGYRKIYELARAAVPQSIDENKKATDAEKGARKEIVTLLLDVLSESIDKVPNVDAMIDITPSKNHHSIILAIGSTNAAKINQIIEKIPVAKAGWMVAPNVEKVGDATIHKLTFGEKSPKSLLDFYGASKTVYFAVGEKTFWISGGENSLENLKSHLEKVAQPLPAEGDGTLLSFKMNAYPILKNLHEITNDPELELLNELNFQTRNKRLAAENPDEPKKKREEGRPGARAADLSAFKWQETAISTLEGSNDLFEMNLQVDKSNELHGHSNAQSGILKAVGAVIVKFADETLK